jgi:uncharacterized membrane protein (UPF0127 family)
MKKILLLLLLALPLLTACGESSDIPTLTLADREFTIDIVVSDTAKANGLMGWNNLAENQGMLFVYQDSAPRVYWMKDMKIAIDILFFDEGKQLIDVYSDVPPCTAEPCVKYPSHSPAKYVLELAAGTAEKLNLIPGAKFSL